MPRAAIIFLKKPNWHLEELNEKAMQYARMMQKENLSQNGLAKKLGISRVRISQILNLLKLPQEQQDYIIAYGKEKRITERGLRNTILRPSDSPLDEQELNE